MERPEVETGDSSFFFNLKIINFFMGILNAAFSCFVIFGMLHMMSPYSTHKPEEDESPYGPVFAALYSLGAVLVLIFLAKLVLEMCFLYAVIKQRPEIVKMFSTMAMWNFLISTLVICLHVPSADSNTGLVCFEHLYMIFLIYSVILSSSLYKNICKQQVPQQAAGRNEAETQTNSP